MAADATALLQAPVAAGASGAPAPADDERARVAALIDGYRDAFARGDARAAAAAYRTPYAIVRPELTRVVDSAAACQAELGRIIDFYRWCGMARVVAEALRMEGGAGVWLVHATWLTLDGAGAPINRVDASYVVASEPGRERIIGLIGHNETIRRLPALRARAALGPGERLAPLGALRAHGER